MTREYKQRIMREAAECRKTGGVGTPIPDGVQGRNLWPMLTGQAYPKEEFESVHADSERLRRGEPIGIQ